MAYSLERLKRIKKPLQLLYRWLEVLLLRASALLHRPLLRLRAFCSPGKARKSHHIQTLWHPH